MWTQVSWWAHEIADEGWVAAPQRAGATTIVFQSLSPLILFYLIYESLCQPLRIKLVNFRDKNNVLQKCELKAAVFWAGRKIL